MVISRYRNRRTENAVKSCRLLVIALLAAIPASGLAPGRQSSYGDMPSKRYDAVADTYRREIVDLAAQCESQQLSAAAAWVRRRVRPNDRYALSLYGAAEHDEERPPDLPADVARRLRKLRTQYAAAIFELAEQAGKTGQGSLALMRLGEVLVADPDHAAARSLLGYQRHQGSWCPAAEAQRLAAGEIWDPRFGWLPETDVARYEAGQRKYNGRWITAEQEARIRSDISRGWQIETAHFEITTNHSRAAAVQLAGRLERLYAAWWQLFADYHLAADELQRMFATGRPPAHSGRRHQVVYFRDHDQYQSALRKMQPGIERTLGIYFADVRTSFFFAGENQDPGTVLHEATHQLFQEVRPTRKIVALRDNFWVIEGIACYMESLRTESGRLVVGGLAAGRLPAARVRLLDDGFYVPFAELVAYGTRQIQRDPRIRTLYSQFTGQTAFLMHYDGGRYRGALMQYLRDVYRGAAGAETLARHAGVEYATLDKQYRQFLTGGAND